ncbi:MAG: hypothetical protein H8E10_09250 [Desulfobacterales bacterium]|nr:hypothetical protein [Desulfobacterales bacterium]
MIKKLDKDCFQVEAPEHLTRYDLQRLADEIAITLIALEQELVEGAPTVFMRGEECAS